LIDVFQSDVPIFDLHRWAYMHLETDYSFAFAIGWIFINDLAHEGAVDVVFQLISFRNDSDFIPIVFLDQQSQGIPVAQRAYFFSRPPYISFDVIADFAR